jgi:deoxyribodipyrimidine photo-lyase
LPKPALVWFRRDLRLADNPALTAAAASGRPILPVYVHDEITPGIRPLGGAGRWWLHHSLAALAGDIARLGSRLVLRRGPAADVLSDVVRQSGADRAYWNRLDDPSAAGRDRAIERALGDRGIAVESFNASLLAEPDRIATRSGKPFRVFTPFWKALQEAMETAPPLRAPEALPGYEGMIDGDALENWGLLPTGPDWAAGFRPHWRPGEGGARRRFEAFRDGPLAGYAEGRDNPGAAGTSRLSPHLHFGEIGPRQVWHAVMLDREQPDSRPAATGGMAFLRELGWREFNRHLLFHHPEMATSNVNAAFDAFPWRTDKAGLLAWQRGETGYPIVDAGMRELWRTGWMHNRVRMIAASFLVKHLLIDWRQGEAWFWDTLVDADTANNAGNWQWVAGSGFDAAPYFRIFNPVLQGERFDADGAYVRRWVPEIAGLPDRYLHRPWEAPAHVLADAGVRLGDSYPAPIVDHKQARQRALDAYAAIKNLRAGTTEGGLRWT